MYQKAGAGASHNPPGARHLKKGASHLLAQPKKLRFEFIEHNKHTYSVSLMCSMLGVSASGYYAWVKRPVSEREMANEKLVEKIKAVHNQSHKTYGAPRVHRALVGQGLRCNHKRVERLMRLHDIRAKQAKRYRRTTHSNHTHPVAPNLLARDFQAQRPNEKWVSDITYVPTAQGWLYLASVMDLYSRKIVGWAMAKSLSSSLVIKALKMALSQRRPPPGLLHHSDRGSQYAAKAYQDLLKLHHCQVSMSRKGNCYDNAPIESFFASLKNELVHHQAYQSRTEAKTDIFAYIEGFYNRHRLHSTLAYQSPHLFEQAYFRLN